MEMIILILIFPLQKKLHVLTKESDRLFSEINQRKELLSKIEAEMSLVEQVLYDW